MSITYYERPEILAELDGAGGHAVIEASAGTGKTYTLEHLVLDLIISGEASVEEILVVTFTDAATRELRERVRELIRKVCDEGEPKRPKGDGESYWEVDEAAAGRLREALFRFDGASISTIHGFCQRILSEQAFLGGRLFEQEHADGSEMFGLAFREEIRLALAEDGPVGDALRRWLDEGSTLQDLQNLMLQCHREGCPERCPTTPTWDPERLLRVAGALPPLEELKAAGPALFSNARTRGTFESHLDGLLEAAEEMRASKGPYEAASIFIEWAGRPRSLAGQKGSQIDNLRRAALMPGAPEVLGKLSGMLDEMELCAAPPAAFFVDALLPRVQARLAARKRSLGRLDYDDMLLGVRDALEGPNAEVLLDTLRRRFKLALVDEFQDTDQVQWDIFRRVFVDGTDEHRIFVIGDPKQAIYGFRGADVHTYDEAKRHLMERRGARRVVLPKSYRSTEPLIESVNQVLTYRGEDGKGFFDGLNRYDEPVRCGDPTRTAKEAGSPAAPVHLLHLHGGDRKLAAGAIKRGVACFIGEEILRLTRAPGGLVTGGKGREPAPIELSDIHVLTRTAKEGRAIGQVLRSYGVPHAFYKQDGLFQTEEAQDIHRLLCAIDSPGEPAARMSAWLTPFFDVPLSDLSAWSGAGESHPLVALMLEWKRLADAHAWSRLFDGILAGSGIVRRLVFADSERALTNYLHVFEVLLAEAHSRPVTLRELTRGLKARIDGRKTPEGREGDVQRLETDKEAVQILTMHKAKGLEAEVVFIGGGFTEPPSGYTSVYHMGSERRLHLGKATGEIAQAIAREKREEEQRLMYVAMTRARSRLYLPFFGGAPDGSGDARYGYGRLGSFYKRLNERLEHMCREGRLDDASRFSIREVSCLESPPVEREAGVDLSGWPEDELLEPPPTSAPEARRIAPGHRGVLLTSYTRMSRRESWQAPTADTDDRASRRDEEVAGEVEAEELGDTLEGGAGGETSRRSFAGGGEETLVGELPGGREAGIFLHALLEDVPLDESRDRDLESFSSNEEVMERAAAIARRHGFSEALIPVALRFVHEALTAPIHTASRESRADGAGSGSNRSSLSMPRGIASGERQRPEMAFIYPIPERGHPLFAAPRGMPRDEERGEPGPDWPPYEVVRGYVQGLVDLVFEHEGRVYLLDWKSDRLPSFDQATVDAHVEANYGLQARVYALAVIRLLGIESKTDYERRFGGILYSFIRGVGEAGDDGSQEGVWFSRPAWEEVASWERELLDREEWGGEVIEPRAGIHAERGSERSTR